MRIRWTEPASRDLTGICDYTQEHHGLEPARKLASRIYEAIGSLLQFPHLGRLGRKPGTRELVLPGSPFLAVYRIRKDVIEIAEFCMAHSSGPSEQGSSMFQSLFEHLGLN